jgi:hypothetical protein
MSQPSQGTSADAKVQSIMDALIASYGSLAAPNFRKSHVTMAGPPHRKLIAELRRKGMNILETTDENDDVSTQLVAIQSSISPCSPIVTRLRSGGVRWGGGRAY